MAETPRTLPEAARALGILVGDLSELPTDTFLEALSQRCSDMSSVERLQLKKLHTELQLSPGASPEHTEGHVRDDGDAGQLLARTSSQSRMLHFVDGLSDLNEALGVQH